MDKLRKSVFFSAIILFGLWFAGNWDRIAGTDDGFIRFVLGTIFAVLVLLRWKSMEERKSRLPGIFFPAAIACGTLMAISGIVFEVNQLEWLGIIVLLYTALRWSLPKRFYGDLLLAMVVLYWVHPLPGQMLDKFQLMMQELSVSGAEWVLHCISHPVWAAETVLYTGTRTFLVPEACSGMKTGVTVLITAMGVCLLYRLRWYEIFVFMVIGFVQVIAANIIRIALMVWMSPNMPEDWADNFLHDTLGIFLIITIFIIQSEISAWKMFRSKQARLQEGIDSGELEDPEKASHLPLFWKILFQWGWVAVVLGLGIWGGTWLKDKSSAKNRGKMISEVISGLTTLDPKIAERAVDDGLAYLPENRDLRSRKARVMFRLNKFEEALESIDQLSEPLSIFEKVVKSWSLMSLGRKEEAIAVVRSLPEDSSSIPDVALVLAQYAVLDDEPFECARHLPVASSSHTTIERVRALFRYLASREQWSAIKGCVSTMPYSNVENALIELRANLMANDLDRAEEIVDIAIQSWPDEPRFIKSIYDLALANPGSKWDKRFEHTLKANLNKAEIEDLQVLGGYCFGLSRADLGWMVYMRTIKTAKDHPLQYFLVAKYADQWMKFRKRQLGLAAEDPSVTTDARVFYQITSSVKPFSRLWSEVPLVADIASLSAEDLKLKYGERCLDAMDTMNEEGRMSESMNIMRADVLAILSRYDEAGNLLKKMQSLYPENAAAHLLKRAVLTAGRQKWQETYELINEYRELNSNPGLLAELLGINSMMELKMGVAAMEAVSRVQSKFPESQELKLARAGVWSSYGFYEQGLFELDRVDDKGMALQLKYILLRNTGRFDSARKAASVLGFSFDRKKYEYLQKSVLLPAEISVKNMWAEPLTAEEMLIVAEKQEAVMKDIKSPFLREMVALITGWLRNEGGAGYSDSKLWLSKCRNDYEKMTVLHQLASMLAQAGEVDKACSVLKEGIELSPASPVLWRLLVALTAGRTDILRDASEAIPLDPELWLARMVVKISADSDRTWVKTELARVIDKDLYSVGTMVRAGDYLMRNDLLDEAEIAVSYVVEKSPEFIPALVLAISCRVKAGDMEGAKKYATLGAEYAVDPEPFYKFLVMAKTTLGERDSQMMKSLEYLRDKHPVESRWSEQLGQIYYQSNETRRALKIIEELDKRGAKVGPRARMLAAESARRDNDLSKAIAIAHKAYIENPDDIEVLNNYVYYLSLHQATQEKARELLNVLLDKGSDSFIVLDTAAMVLFKTGDTESARKYSDMAVKKLDKTSEAAAEVLLNSARIYSELGEYDKAEKIIVDLRKIKGIKRLIDHQARLLYRQILKKKKERKDQGAF